MDNDKRQQQLEAYKDLSRWNRHDVMVTLSWDRIFIPLVGIGWAAAYAKYPERPEVFGAAFFTGVRVLLFWLAHCARHRNWMASRFNTIKQIEEELEIVGHKDVPLPRGRSNMKVRCIFFGIFVFIGVIMLVWLIVKKVCL